MMQTTPFSQWMTTKLSIINKDADTHKGDKRKCMRIHSMIWLACGQEDMLSSLKSEKEHGLLHFKKEWSCISCTWVRTCLIYTPK